jgi:DEAD/DEAH box helicase domain-containing protein
MTEPYTPLERLLSLWRTEKTISSNIVEWHVDSARPASYGEFPAGLHPAITAALQQRGIVSLYSHQCESWERVSRGENIVAITGTASGKTLCYNLPVLNTCLRNSDATALYLFPTKALAQDQKEGLHDFINDIRSNFQKIEPGLDCPDLLAAIYDGDTPSAHRSTIRTKARILLTNPDMLHIGILPHHTLWSEFFRNLKYIAIDEVHIYRGVFGSHIANVIRRLKRIARFYGANPQFILTSATIANPGSLSEKLVEAPVQIVANDGSPRGPRHFLLYNPPIVDKDLGIRRGSNAESVRLAGDLLAYGVQTLMFARTRCTVELILTNLQYRQAGQENEVHGYRSGYLPAERRAIERSLRSGDTRAVVSTNALELGVDIGGADAVILVGYPGTIAASRQQAGRAGRRQETSLAVLVASAGPLDQYLMQHPEYLFENSPEQALINPDNLLILLQHLRCAAFELPFRLGECFGTVSAELFKDLMAFLEQSNILHKTGDRYFWMSDEYPANTISLRSASNDPVLLQVEEDGVLSTVGEVDKESASWMVHPHAIYIHEGKTYQVDHLSLEESKARLSAIQVDYYTEPRKDVQIEKLSMLREEVVPAGSKNYGEILVTSQVVGYRKMRWFSHEVLAENPIEMPPSHLRTVAYWVSLNEESLNALRDMGLWKNDPNNYGPNWHIQRSQALQRDRYKCQLCGVLEGTPGHHVHHIVPFRQFTSWIQANQLQNLVTLCPSCHKKAELSVRMRSGLSGLVYTLHHMAPLFLMCDGGDLGYHADPESSLADGAPVAVLYDQLPAGIGLSDTLYDMHQGLMDRCYELVNSCPCKDGCPGCVGPAGENGISGKLETLALLALFCGKVQS